MIATIILICALTTDADRQQPAEGPFLFELLTETQARQLHGEWVTVRIRLDSMPRYHAGCTLYDCVNRDDNHRTVWFVGEPMIDETKPLTVRGRLVVIRHKPSMIGNTAFEGFTEIRLMGAKVMK